MDIKEVVSILLGTEKGTNSEDSYVVKSYWEITSHRKYFGNLIIFIKKVIRKGIFWFIDPIVQQQNNINILLKNNIEKNKKESNDEVIAHLIHEIEKLNEKLDKIACKNRLKE